MEEIVIQKEQEVLISKEEFVLRASKTEDIFEFDNGRIIKMNSMKNEERYLVSNLLRKFQQTQAYQQRGELLPETDCWLTDSQMRRPDLSFFTKLQIEASAKAANPIPGFVIEIISKNDENNQVEKKTY